MSWYRKSKLALNSLTSLTSKFITSRAPNHQFKPRTSPYTISSLIKKPIYEIPGFKRSYYVDRNQVHHFRPRGPRRWFQNPRKVLILVLVGGGVIITLVYGNIETVPYTKRKHFVLLSRSLEKELGQREFERLKKSMKGKILPAIHPMSIRVRLIAKDLIEALQRGIKQENMWSDPSYASETSGLYDEVGGHTWRALDEDVDESMEGGWRSDDEVLDDRWVQKSRKKAEARGEEAATKHLEGLNWEVLVVDEPVVNAFCLPAGKIVVFTGLLQHFKTDAEIATIIGHEVAHAVARHSAEGLTKNMWVAIAQLVLLQFVSMPDLVNAMSNLLLRLPFSRRMEMEADYIGLLLLASAGYDPQIAPKVYEKLGQITGGDSALRDYLSTHPSGKKRAQLLARAQVMEEALRIYNEVRAGRQVQDFLY
ncbi:hypothetical protein IFM89_026806 [Coptis chinensis]|uniref:Peptidase M48 domain-containing protein n=1 Tax=Coptis chinensis TaxID=261450 RepID=A0A835M1U7_9MAGN|nr:hypothetical protein IFM89_026806 [Coptis chinensis]